MLLNWPQSTDSDFSDCILQCLYASPRHWTMLCQTPCTSSSLCFAYTHEHRLTV